MNMEGYWSGAVQKAKAEVVEVTARAIRQMPSVKPLVVRMGRQWGGRGCCTSSSCSVCQGGCKKDPPTTEEAEEGFPAEDGAVLGTAATAADSFVWLAE